jgi:hypothetical protein
MLRRGHSSCFELMSSSRYAAVFLDAHVCNGLAASAVSGVHACSHVCTARRGRISQGRAISIPERMSA